MFYIDVFKITINVKGKREDVELKLSHPHCLLYSFDMSSSSCFSVNFVIFSCNSTKHIGFEPFRTIKTSMEDILTASKTYLIFWFYDLDRQIFTFYTSGSELQKRNKTRIGDNLNYTLCCLRRQQCWTFITI
jgi:hypothetical protein